MMFFAMIKLKKLNMCSLLKYFNKKLAKTITI